MRRTRRCAATLASAAILLAMTAGAAGAAPGDPDPSFGGDGRKTFDAGGYDHAEAVLVQPDGKLLIAGSADYDLSVTRLNRDGSVDPAFGTAGIRKVDFGAYEVGHSLVLQPDGRILVAGYTASNGGDGVVVRLNADGSLDDTFDGDGRKRVGTSAYDFANEVLVQTNGRIVVVGVSNNDVAAWRLNPDGSPDVAFDGDGAAFVDFGAAEAGWAAALQADGRIVVAGYASENGDFAVVRFNAGGSLDTSFSFDGRNTVNFGGADLAKAVLVQANGRIVVAGWTWNGGDAALARLNVDGSLDPTFDGDGKATIGDAATSSAADAVLLQPDGRLVATGYVDGTLTIWRLNANGSLDYGFGGGGAAALGFGVAAYGYAAVRQADGRIVAVGYSGTDSAIARVNANGSPDETFGGEGARAFSFGGYEVARSVLVQPDGRIVAAGIQDGDFTVMRLLPHGSFDTSFAQGGVRELDFGGYEDASAIARQADGKLVVAGHTFFPDGGQGLAVARLNPDGSPDATFDGDGLRVLDFPGYDYAYALLVQPDGRIVVVGHGGVNADFAVTRLNANGSPDVSFGAGGWVSVDLGGYDVARAVARQGDGKLVVAGETTAGFDVGVVRLNANGSLDPSFDGDGRKTFGYAGDDGARAVLVQSDGKLVVAGYGGPDTTLAVTRLLPSGAFDTSFDQDGSRGIDFGGYEAGFAAALQPNGRIVVAGYTSAAEIATAVARLNPDGTPDTSFSGDGRTTIDRGDGRGVAYAMALQGNGRIVLAGLTALGSDALVARLIGD
jgi:uncharacterized delta-60 repeat protein